MFGEMVKEDVDMDMDVVMVRTRQLIFDFGGLSSHLGEGVRRHFGGRESPQG